MLAVSVALAVLAFALAWPVPLLLGAAAWPSRAPATALVLWQAIALAGGLSMIGSLLAFGLAPFGPDLPSAAAEFVRASAPAAEAPSVPLVHLFALSAGVLLAGHLVLNLVLTIVRIEHQRRRHERLVTLLSAPVPDRPNTRLLDSPMPVAYCLPGGLRSVTVFSAGLVDLLDEDQLQAVIEHEKAHLLQRHYMVLLAFDAWRTSLPWFPIATRAMREVGMLVEMLADDRARHTAADDALASAIVLVSGDSTAGAGTGTGVGAAGSAARVVDPAWSLLPVASAPSDTRARVRRLLSGEPPLPAATRTVVWACAVALVALPTVILLAPGLAR